MKDPHALFANVERDVAPFLESSFPEHVTYAARNLTRTLLKKWVPPTDDGLPTARAALSFLEANHLSEEWKWRSSEDPLLDRLFNGLVMEMDRFFFDRGTLLFPSYGQLLDRGRTGPGAALGADGQSFYSKLGSSRRLTTTSPALYEMYRAYTALIPTWEEGESLRASQTEYGVEIVDTSRMTFVPKNSDTDRAICVEPSLNMFLQLGAESLMRDRMLKLWNVDLETQPDINRLLARIGSRGGDFATIDLASASDLISLELVRQTVPSYAFGVFDELRVPYTELPEFGLRVKLGMMSTMGNGFTFPLMTVLLSCAVRATYRELGIVIHDNPRTQAFGVLTPGNWAVFGDDIIVCREAYDVFCQFLAALGLRVNLAKSFNQGQFRESCGHDYLSGHDVRGVYLKRLASRQDIAIAVNLLNDWSFRTGIPLRESVRYLLEGQDDLPRVPFADNLDSGIRVPSSVFRGSVRDKRGRNVQKCMYRSYEQRSKTYRFGDDFVVSPKRGRRWFYNGPLLLLSLLKGELRNGRISVRHNENLYRTRWRVTPYWDYMPTSVWVNPRTDWQRWSTAVEYNVLDLEA